jgi:hypothetical protein
MNPHTCLQPQVSIEIRTREKVWETDAWDAAWAWAYGYAGGIEREIDILHCATGFVSELSFKTDEESILTCLKIETPREPRGEPHQQARRQRQAHRPLHDLRPRDGQQKSRRGPSDARIDP